MTGPRENAETKARRYLTEGRLIIERVDVGRVEATCRGDAAVYRLGYVNGRWVCSCPASGRCAHLLALGLVVAPSKLVQR